VAALTLWCLFSAWLLFPRVGAPRMLRTAAALLMWLEFLALLTWSYAVEAARIAAAVDLPALTLAMLTIATAYAARRSAGARRPESGLRRTRR
jgi:hypothetical protein